VAVNKPGATSFELRSSQTSWLIAQNSSEKLKNYIQKTTAGNGSGCNQAQGYELWAHMLTIKLIDSSEFRWKKIIKHTKTTAGIGSGCEQAQGHKLWAHMLTYKLIDTSEFKWKKNLQGKNHCRFR
jgi:hypothetical protein